MLLCYLNLELAGNRFQRQNGHKERAVKGRAFDNKTQSLLFKVINQNLWIMPCPSFPQARP